MKTPNGCARGSTAQSEQPLFTEMHATMNLVKYKRSVGGKAGGIIQFAFEIIIWSVKMRRNFGKKYVACEAENLVFKKKQRKQPFESYG